MANKNPSNKFKPGNKAGTGKRGKEHRSTIVKRLIKDAETLSAEYGNIVDFRKLVYLNYFEGLTDKNKQTRINVALKLGDFFDPKKKIVDAGDNIQKILEVHRPLEHIISGTMPIPFPQVTVNLNNDPEVKMKADRKRINELAKKLKEQKLKSQKKPK